MSLSGFEVAAKQRIRVVWLGLLLSGVFLLWLSEFSTWGYRVGFWVSRQFYEVGVGFPLKDSASFEFWWHKFPKYAVYAVPVWALINVVYAYSSANNLMRRTQPSGNVGWQCCSWVYSSH